MHNITRNINNCCEVHHPSKVEGFFSQFQQIWLIFYSSALITIIKEVRTSNEQVSTFTRHSNWSCRDDIFCNLSLLSRSMICLKRYFSPNIKAGLILRYIENNFVTMKPVRVYAGMNHSVRRGEFNYSRCDTE